ncbi:bacterial-type DNA primase [Cenarchaeum symbiosum A]|uniref:Bacterial-type DNA primase n=1 Tax=Cenarchaeum symbiosum (strain A) TaxID=414004 RepID=A0RTX4_CENSY|nr:bacterial-type DNA primase [Cenarchaeum symbiosum A]
MSGAQRFKNTICMHYTVHGKVSEYQVESTVLSVIWDEYVSDGTIFNQTLRVLKNMGYISSVKVDVESNDKDTIGSVIIHVGSNLDCGLMSSKIKRLGWVHKFPAKFKTGYVGPTSKFSNYMTSHMLNRATANSALASDGGADLGKLKHGRTAYQEKWIILVEGAADVAHLARIEYQNTMEIGGARLDDRALDLARTKEKVVAFMDGDDKGADNLRRLRSILNIDEGLLADRGVEVEELGLDRIMDLLKPAVKRIKKEMRDGSRKSRTDAHTAEI